MSTIAISVAADVWGPASHIWLAGCGTCVYVSGYLAPYICPLDRFSYGWNMSTIGISGRGQTSGVGAMSHIWLAGCGTCVLLCFGRVYCTGSEYIQRRTRGACCLAHNTAMCACLLSPSMRTMAASQMEKIMTTHSARNTAYNALPGGRRMRSQMWHIYPVDICLPNILLKLLLPSPTITTADICSPQT